MSTEPKIKKLRAEDWTVSEREEFVNLGFDLSARSVLGWDVSASKNLLVAGYGVRQTEWAITAIVQHFKHYSKPTYVQDFSSFVSGFPKGTFAGFTNSRSDGEKMLQELATSTDEHVLVVAAAEHLIAPTYLVEEEREQEAARHSRIVAALEQELANPAAHVVLVTSRLHQENALPSALLKHFSTYMVSSKIFARDQQHVLREDQDPQVVEKSIKAMSATHSLLLPAGGRVQEFESFRAAKK